MIPLPLRALRWAWLLAGLTATGLSPLVQALELNGVTVTPHLQLDTMRYRKDPEPAVGARVQLFLVQPDTAGPAQLPAAPDVRIGGQTPAALLDQRLWAWHDLPQSNDLRTLPPGSLTVWTFNSRAADWGPGSRPELVLGPATAPLLRTNLALDRPRQWISAVTFLAPTSQLRPDTTVVHLANDSGEPVRLVDCRFWLPPDPRNPRVLMPQPRLQAFEAFGGQTVIPAREMGGFRLRTDPLPLTYAALEVRVQRDSQPPQSLWTHLRIKPEHFDISGGWVNEGGAVTHEAFLKTLKRLHVNTAHLATTPGYTDTPLYARYPLKYFHQLTPFETYDTDALLPRIHAVEFLGEPQYGGGRPVPPQEVWEKLQPYAPTRLPTSLTHSEERIWRDYAGLSDFPHYDAYRVSAPAPDAWSRYDRWGGERIRWGAPLETIGDMCRSLRELNRPLPCAYWSQGPHAGWDVYGGRRRTSPTPAELRLQAYHAVSTRITSLYWFNLSLKSLVKFRDTLDELGRVGRELRLLDEFLLEGQAYRHLRRNTAVGEPDWDLSSVAGPRAALLFALDLQYRPDPVEKVFQFGPPRAATWSFPIPSYLSGVRDVFRIDADGIHDVNWRLDGQGVHLSDTTSQVAVYFATPDPQLRRSLEAKRQALIKEEAGYQFDPARNDADFAELVALEKRLSR